MQSILAKTIIGAVIAVALAVAGSYGLISQQIADKVQTQADLALRAGSSAPPATRVQPPLVPQPEGKELASRISSGLRKASLLGVSDPNLSKIGSPTSSAACNFWYDFTEVKKA